MNYFEYAAFVMNRSVFTPIMGSNTGRFIARSTMEVAACWQIVGGLLAEYRLQTRSRACSSNRGSPESTQSRILIAEGRQTRAGAAFSVLRAARLELELHS